MSRPNPLQVAAWRLEGPPIGVRFSPDGRSLHAYDARSIYTWSISEFEEVRRFPIDPPPRKRNEHCRFLSGGEDVLLIASERGSEEGIHHLAVRNLETLAIQFEGDLQLEHYGLLAIVFNRAESLLLLRDCGGASHFVEFPSITKVHSIQFDAEAFAPRGAARAEMVFSPDEREIWSICSFDEPSGCRQYLGAFDLATGRGLRRRPPDQGDAIDGLQWTPDARALLVVEEKRLGFRDPATWNALRTVDLTGSLRKGWGDSHPATAFSPCSPLVALSCEYNTRVCIADQEASKLIGVFDVDEEFCVRLLQFSPCGRYLAIASYDVEREVRVWDLSRLPAM